jgi:hypothetical protein
MPNVKTQSSNKDQNPKVFKEFGIYSFDIPLTFEF